MEEGSGHKDDESKAASDEVESAERAGANNDDTAGSSVRSYECIFCKRGFSTAQALGGHMNIHRRDRVRMARSGPTAARRAEFDGSALYHPYNNPTHRRSTSVSSASASYAVYLPEATTASVASRPSDESPSRSTRELSFFGDDLHLGMKAHEEQGKGPAEDQEKIEGEGEEEEEEAKFDLELRLGNKKQ